jgi:hypothetical protein
VGGGLLSADTVSVATSLSLTTVNQYAYSARKTPFLVLPNGDIVFFTDSSSTTVHRRFRYYTASTNVVTSIKPSGAETVVSGKVIADLTKCAYPDIYFEYNTATSALSTLYTSFYASSSTTGCLTPNLTGSSTVDGMVKLNTSTDAIDTSQVVAAYPPGTTMNTFSQVAALDGKIYIVDRNSSYIYSYSSSTNQWTALVGTGVAGACADGTAPLSCAIDPGGAFVASTGQLYFIDRGLIRTIINNQVTTLYGQAYNYGDGGLATNARFGTLYSVVQRSDSKFITTDMLTGRMRMFARSGTVSTIAGNDTNGSQSLSSIATATGLPIQSSSYGIAGNIFLDSSNGIYYYNGNALGVAYLPNTYATSPSTTYWTYPKASGTAWFSGSTKYNNANGLLASVIKPTGAGFNILGINSSSLLLYGQTTTAGVISSIVMYEVGISNSTVTFDLGPSGTAGTTCADGTLLSACTNSPTDFGNPELTANYDSVNQYWVYWDSVNNTYRTIGTGETGTINSLSGTFATPQAFMLQRFSSYNNHLYLYECSAGGVLYLHDTTAGTRAVLTIPVPGMLCNSSQLTYDPNAHSLAFTFIQNGLSGVAELLNVDPSQNGL